MVPGLLDHFIVRGGLYRSVDRQFSELIVTLPKYSLVMVVGSPVPDRMGQLVVLIVSGCLVGYVSVVALSTWGTKQ